MSKQHKTPGEDAPDYDFERELEAQVQQELEEQFRAFGSSMNSAFRHGFEGRGQELGDRAYGVGRAVADAANLGLSKAGKALKLEWDNARTRKAAGEEGAMPAWARQIFGADQPGPVEEIRASAKKRHNAGVAMLTIGITFAAIFGLGAVGCLVVAGSFQGLYALSAAMVDILNGSGIFLLVCTAPFAWMTAAGAERLEAARQLGRYADAAEGLDAAQGIPLEMLAGLAHEKKKHTLKTLRSLIRKGWLSAWLDEKKGRVFLTAESFRAAQKGYRPAPAPEAQPAPAPKAQPDAPANAPEGEKPPLNLEAVRSFAAVLEKQKKLMRDERAVEELEHMHRTSQAICDWLEAHPESLPKARRFAEYYIPTTLKLLYTYNDVQGQRGGNAEAIRRDIAGILHTLNQAYDNLYDTLLSDMALDVSSEIAALEGMLACDGLTGEGLR